MKNSIQVVICSCLEELHQRIDVNQLTSELGGCLFYHHQEWIDTRVVIHIKVSFYYLTADEEKERKRVFFFFALC